MDIRSRLAVLLLTLSVGAPIMACSVATSSSPEEHAGASTEALRFGHACPPTCDPGFHCGTICDTCAVRTMVPRRPCDPVANYFECVPDVCPARDAGPEPIDQTQEAP